MGIKIPNPNASKNIVKMIINKGVFINFGIKRLSQSFGGISKCLDELNTWLGSTAAIVPSILFPQTRSAILLPNSIGFMWEFYPFRQ